MKKILYIIISMFLIINSVSAYSTNSNVQLQVSLFNSTYFFDDLNSRFWWWESWGYTVTSLSCVDYAGRTCMRTENTLTNAGGWGGLLRVDHYFKPEEWDGYDSLKCDVFLAEDQTNIRLKLEVYNNSYKIENIMSDKLEYNTWKEITWSFTSSSNYSGISRLLIIIENLEHNNTRNIYFDNFRLANGGSEERWDDCNDRSYKWRYNTGSDVSDYSPWGLWSCEAITHTNTENPSTNSGCIVLPWDQSVSGVNYAEVANADLFDVDVRPFNKISFRARCSSSSARFRVAFEDTTYTNMESVNTNVSANNTWETITINLPTYKAGFSWDHLAKLKFIINTDVVAAGQLYIDDIKFE